MKCGLRLLLLSGVLLTNWLGALNVYITNDNADMISSKKICARINFDATDAALYKDMLCISVDTPDLELKGWRTIAQAPAHYVPNFKKNKRLFTESFNLEILFDFEKQDKPTQLALLEGSSLSISSLVLTKEGKNRAENVIVPLKVAPIAEDLALTATATLATCMAEYTSTLLPYQRSFDFFNRTKRLATKQELNEVLIIDRTKELWRMMRTGVGAWICSFSFYKWYFILWLLFILLCLRWLYPVFRFVVPLSWRWHREVVIFTSLLIFLFTWWLLRWWLSVVVWYLVLSGVSALASFYYLWGGSETFLERCKVLIGIIFAVAVLPLLVLAWIHGGMK